MAPLGELPEEEEDGPLPEGDGVDGPEDELPEGAEGAEGTESELEPDDLNAKSLREAAEAIDNLGMPLVTKAYAKNFALREDALLAVLKMMQEGLLLALYCG